MLSLFASGNSNVFRDVSWPATSPIVIAVGASDSVNGRWDYSCYGPELDLVAPSGDVVHACSKIPGDSLCGGHFWTLDQMGELGENNGSKTCLTMDADYRCDFGGTSAAIPQAAGVAALVLLRRPDLLGQTALLRDILRYSSDRLHWGHTDTARVNDEVGWGRLNAARALLAVVRGDANNDGVVNIPDALYINAHIFGSGPAPVPHLLTGDANGSGGVSISDAVYIIAHVFGGGPPPPVCFKY